MWKNMTLYSHANLQNEVFLYKKYIRKYIQRYSQPYISEIYSGHLFFSYNIFFTKSIEI